MDGLPPELIVLLPLAVAAGIDLYLTLLFLGAAPTTSWWSEPLPGALGDLDSPGVLIMVGTFYLLEFSAERYATSGLVWNAFHAVIRPVAGALLALLLLDGEPLWLAMVGAVIAGAVASFAHAVRSGGAIVRWLGSARSPHVLLVSMLEDALVVGLAVLAIDLPWYALGVAAVLVVGAAATAGLAHARAFGFAVRLAVARVSQTLTQRRWLGPEELPGWVRRSLEDDVLAPGGGLRGSPAGAHRLPGAPRFATGWIVVRGGSPLFVYRRRKEPASVDLGPLIADGVVETAFFRRVDLHTRAGAPARVFFGVNGPSEASLRAEFLVA
ncbi:MAG: DUF4126 domain-containing protein [Longimicrobiales bacterium]